MPGLLCFALISVLGNGLDLYLRYPDLGAAVLFPPYAALYRVSGLLPASDLGLVPPSGGGHPRGDPLVTMASLWVLAADVANLARALTAAGLLTLMFRAPRSWRAFAT